VGQTLLAEILSPRGPHCASIHEMKSAGRKVGKMKEEKNKKQDESKKKG